MRILRRLIISLALALPLVAPTQALAGGWWSFIDLDDPYLVPGDPVDAETPFLFASIDAAERAHRTGEYFAYLIAGLDWSMVREAKSRPDPSLWWSIEGARAIRVGSVTIRGRDGNFARATTRFELPQWFEPGRYALMFCDAGCRNPLGDIVPVSVRVVESRSEAELARRVDELERQLHERSHQIRRLRETVAEGADDADIGSLRARIVVLEAQLSRALEAPSVPSGSLTNQTPWWSLAGWFLGGLAITGLVAALVWRSRRSPGPADQDRSSLSLDDELLALTRREGGSARTGGRTGP
jgi:hypothetical protein